MEGCGGHYWIQWRPSRQIASSKDTNPYFLAFSAAFIILHSVPTSAIVCNWSCCSRNMSEHVAHRKQLRTQSFIQFSSVHVISKYLQIASLFLLILEGGTIEGLALSQEEVFSSYHVYSLVTGIYFYILLHIFFLLPAISRRSKVFTNNLCFKALISPQIHSATAPLDFSYSGFAFRKSFKPGGFVYGLWCKGRFALMIPSNRWQQPDDFEGFGRTPYAAMGKRGKAGSHGKRL